MTNEQNDPSVKSLETALNDLQTYLNGDNDPLNTLKGNWIFLQVYATYGLRLPNTAASLQSVLNLTASEAAAYSWFDAMYGAYNTLNEDSTYFFNEVFDKMTTLGSGLKSYASNVAGQDSVFTLISSLVKPTDGSQADPASALDILKDLTETSQQNATLAAQIKTNLGTYKSKLVSAQSTLGSVKTDVDNDDKTSQATINKLSGGPEVTGSLKQLENLLDADKAEYKHDVVVASTTVTYAWVAPPVGLAAAATVAGIYGKKAVDMLDTIDKLEGQIANAEKELQTAVATQNTVKLAEGGLDNVIKYTDLAIDKATSIQNSWNGMVTGLTNISNKISSSIENEPDGEKKLAATIAVVYFMKKAQESWTSIKPTIDVMVDNPYITVSPADKDLKTFAEEVVKEANELEHA